MFNKAHDFTVTGNFIEGNVGSVTYINTTSNKFMKKLLKETIPGAGFDSSARDPPPRCHPGTRLAILRQCINFIGNCEGEKKMCWVVAAAGVGKSAVMQSVAESPNLPVTSQASVFFSVNGRNDGTKVIKTISYQLAAKSEPYRQLIEHEIARDPALLQSSMATQFEKLIVGPFIHNSLLNVAGRVLVIVDGLDECNQTRTQQELLRLISDFCITHPSSPIVWLIASRPEPHITSFFARAKVIPAYEKEEIMVDSDAARQDVEQFLRHELTEIKDASDSLDPHSQWPEERVLWKIADAAGGLFAYGDTVVKYIGDSTGDPASQLTDVLHVIDNHPMINVPREEHPMVLLDSLYDRILSKAPSKILMNTRKLLLQLATDWSSNLKSDEKHFIVLCNWLALTADEAYAAINHLRSVLRIPRREEAHFKELRPFHKSFIDYISDFNRSGFSRDITREAQQSNTQYSTFRILKEAPDGISTPNVVDYGKLKRGDKISLTWSVHKRLGSDDMTRMSMYKLAVREVAEGMERRESIFQSELCVRLLTTRLQYYDHFSLHAILGDFVFNESRCHEFLMHGILKQLPLKAIELSEHCRCLRVNLESRCPAAAEIDFSDSWNLPCDYECKDRWEGGRGWGQRTTSNRASCHSCLARLKQQWVEWKTQYPDHTVTILFSSTSLCPAEVRFVDVKDGNVLQQTYRVWFELSPTERNKLGSIV